MKYVRTKSSGVFIKLYDTDNPDFTVVGKTEIDFGTYIYKNDIIEESDNLVKLIDNLAKKEPNHKHPEWLIGYPEDYLNDERFMNYCVRRIKAGTLKIFGGVWIGDHFVKVAELNKEGKLELV